MIALLRFGGRLCVLALIGALVWAGLFSAVRSVHAVSTVTVDNQVVSCDSIQVTFTVTGYVAGDYSLVYAHRADGTELGLNSLVLEGDGQFTVLVTFAAQPAGTSLYGRVSVGSGEIGRVEAQGAPTSCGGGGDDDDDDAAAADDSSGSQPPPASWGGYSDGRLNPKLAEYYTIYCHAGTDTVYVVRTEPQTETIKEIPLADLIALPVGGALDLGDFMQAERSGEDLITIYGSNGNLAPESGSKSFSLDECIASNGGAPVSPPIPDGGQTPLDGDDAEIILPESADDLIADCNFLYGPFSGSSDVELWVDCLAYATSQDSATSEQIVWVWIMQLCLGLPVGFASIVLGWRYRRRLSQWYSWRR